MFHYGILANSTPKLIENKEMSEKNTNTVAQSLLKINPMKEILIFFHGG